MRMIGLGLAFTITGCLLAYAASPFDGRYTGQFSSAGNGNARCGAAEDFSVVVRDGTFPFGPGDARISIAVGADGSFSGQTNGRGLQGRIQGTQMTATVTAGRCNYIWSLHK